MFQSTVAYHKTPTWTAKIKRQVKDWCYSAYTIQDGSNQNFKKRVGMLNEKSLVQQVCIWFQVWLFKRQAVSDDRNAFLSLFWKEPFHLYRVKKRNLACCTVIIHGVPWLGSVSLTFCLHYMVLRVCFSIQRHQTTEDQAQHDVIAFNFSLQDCFQKMLRVSYQF